MKILEMSYLDNLIIRVLNIMVLDGDIFNIWPG